MEQTPARPAPQIVVGADGTDAGLRAVRCATQEAQRRGLGLRIVHVTPGYTPTGPALPVIPDGSLRSYGLQILRDAAAQVAEEAPQLPVDTVLVTAGRIPGLVTNSTDAAMLFIGNARHSLGERVWTGNTITGVVARAHCPVVVVPLDWSPEKKHGRIVAGFKTTRHATELLEAAVDLATQGPGEPREVVVLHAWKLASGYDDIVANRVAVEEWASSQTQFIEPFVQRVRARHPEVPIRIEIVHDQPANALVKASRTSDHLVLVRPDLGRIFHHLGHVARAVVREAHCPVEVMLPVPAGLTKDAEITEQAVRS